MVTVVDLQISDPHRTRGVMKKAKELSVNTV